MLLRGPQTPGELRPRTERLHPFADREAVEEVLRELAAEEPPLVRELERQAGQHDRRWIHLLGAELPPEAVEPVRAVDREQVLAAGGLARDRKVTAEYDRLAEAYAIALGDDLAEKPFDRWFLEELANSAPGQGLDVGCGPGPGGRSAGRAGHGDDRSRPVAGDAGRRPASCNPTSPSCRAPSRCRRCRGAAIRAIRAGGW